MPVNDMVYVDSDLIITCMKDLNAKNAKTNAMRKKAREVLKGLHAVHQKLKITAFNLIELFKGAYQSADVALNLHRVEKVIADFDVVYLDLDSVKEFARTLTEIESKGIVVPVFDLLIGAIILSKGDTLYTKNVRHFEKIPRLKLIDWEAEQLSGNQEIPFNG